MEQIICFTGFLASFMVILIHRRMKICDVVTELTAGMMAAAVTLPMVVMVAVNVGVEVQLTRCQCLSCFVRIAGHAAVQLDARLLQRYLGTTADAATDQSVHV